MIRAALLTLTLALAAQAQTHPTPEHAASAPKPAPSPDPAAEAARQEQAPPPAVIEPKEKPSEDVRAMACARGFFEALLAGDSHGVIARTSLPFALDAQRITDPDGLKKIFDEALREKRTDLLTLYGIELLTPQEMEKRYGKPPARLAGLPWRSGRNKIALANLSGHGAVAILREVDGLWRVIAYTD